MLQQILLLTGNRTTAHSLRERLSTLGFQSNLSTTLQAPSSLDHPPACVMLDLALRRAADERSWQEWSSDCLTSHTACLAFGAQGEDDLTAVVGLEPLSDTIDGLDSDELLAGKLRALLRLSKLSRQLGVTRQQLRHYQQELQDALSSAAHIQRRLIPRQAGSYHNLQTAWQFLPCKQVGGDLFNVQPLDEQTVMVYLVDVSGHGIASAMVTVSVSQSLSIQGGQLVKQPIEQPPFYRISTPGEVLRELEAEYPFERFEEFFTISYLLINPHNGTLRYCNAGHPPPLLLHADGSVERLEAGGTIIGIAAEVDFTEGAAQLERGARLYLYTDGITEHCDANGEAFGEERLLRSLRQVAGAPLDEAVHDTLITLRAFGGSSLPIDDVTLIGLEFR
jgi:sigma-B regulation protein RsbU (phosphoserine phosphatase)